MNPDDTFDSLSVLSDIMDTYIENDSHIGNILTKAIEESEEEEKQQVITKPIETTQPRETDDLFLPFKDQNITLPKLEESMTKQWYDINIQTKSKSKKDPNYGKKSALIKLMDILMDSKRNKNSTSFGIEVKGSKGKSEGGLRSAKTIVNQIKNGKASIALNSTSDFEYRPLIT